MIHPFYLQIFFDTTVVTTDIKLNYSDFIFSDFILDHFKPVTINYKFDVFHYSTPSIKLYYPEPFIASPTFVHEDIWFLHIVIYQYWLWFFFIFTIVFFFIVFITTVRWCNIRQFPTRETRGISRSKCGDLITSTVPITWAASIIIHESTDAVELAEGSGTSEIAIGVRAYQWGWEYYYPRSLNFGFEKQATPLYVGKSLGFEPMSKGLYSYNKFSWTLRADTAEIATRNPFFLTNKSLCSRNVVHTPLLNNLSFDFNNSIDFKANNFIKGSTVKYWNESLFYSNYTSNFSSYNKIYLYFKKYFKLAMMPTFDTFSGQDTLLFLNSSVNTSKSFIDKFFFRSLFENNFNWKNFFITYNNSIKTPTLFTTHLYNYYSSFKDVQFLVSLTDKEPVLDTKILNNIFNKERFSLYFSLFNLITDTLLPVSNHNALTDFKRISSFENFDSFFSFNYDNNLMFSDLTKNKPTFLVAASPKFNLTFYNIYLLQALNNFMYNNLINFTFLNNKYMRFFNFSNNTFSSYNNNLFINNTELNSIKNIFINRSSRDFFNLQLNTTFSADTLTSLLSSSSILHHFNMDLLKLDFIFNRSFNFFFNERIHSYLSFIWDFSNYVTTTQSIFKVFKPTLEDHKSSSFFSALSYLGSTKPFNYYTGIDFKFTRSGSINSSVISQFTQQNFKPSKFSNLNNFIWNFPLTSPPFIFGSTSDSIRGSWIDWYTPRSSIIAKAIDLADFNLFGTKAPAYNFITPGSLSRVNFFENFFTKFLYTRKYSLPIYSNLPFFFFHNLNLNTVYPFIQSILYEDMNRLNSLNFLLKSSIFFDSNFFFLNWSPIVTYLINWTGFRSFLHFGDLSLSAAANQINTTTRFLDVLTKRDFLRYFFLNSFSLSWTFFDSTYNSRVSFLNDFLDCQSSLTLSRFIRPTIGDADEVALLEAIPISQYEPFRKGVSNMIRIQADKSVAMPTDVRLQILATSKDIIHSWSIPSAGVKIDCIPGYSSHRIVFFTLTGIYWGQCMEICGRFHHWMPIVVYFVKRDIFLMWCIHFVFNEKLYNKHFTSLNPAPSMLLSSPWSYWLKEFDV